MHVLIDHLNAVIVGAILLTALVVLQVRERINSVDETLRYELQARGEAAMLTIGQDFDNLMTRDDATDAGIARARCQITRLAAGPVASVECPGYFQIAPEVYREGVVRYALEDAGYAYTVGDSQRSVYTLRRTIQTATDTLSQPVANSVVDLDVDLFGATGGHVTEGAAPLDLTSLRVSLELAHEGLTQISGDQRAQRHTNIVRFGHTYRPPNLTYLERSGSGGFGTAESEGGTGGIYVGGGSSGGGGGDD